jgi:hypothetical protein
MRSRLAQGMAAAENASKMSNATTITSSSSSAILPGSVRSRGDESRGSELASSEVGQAEATSLDGSEGPSIVPQPPLATSGGSRPSPRIRGLGAAPDQDATAGGKDGTQGGRGRRSSVERVMRSAQVVSHFRRVRTHTSAQKSWRKTGFKVNMMNALRRSNLELRALYGDTLQNEMTSHAAEGRHREAWERGLGIGLEDNRTEYPRCVMHPECLFRQIWDALQVFLLLYVAMAVPLRFCFEVELEFPEFGWFFELFSDIYFVTDIVLNFRTGFVNEEDRALVMVPRHIARRYLRGWFALDVVACLPVSYITQIANAYQPTGAAGGGGGAGSEIKAFKTLRLFRLAKLLRLARIRRIIKRWEEVIGSLMSIVKLMFLLFVVLFMTHVLSCSFYYIGNDPEGWVELSMVDEEPPQVGNGTEHEFREQTLLYRYLRTVSNTVAPPH